MVIEEQEQKEELTVATCGQSPAFINELKSYCDRHVPFVSIIDGGERLEDLLVQIDEQRIDVAIVKLDRFTDLEEEQNALQQKNVAKLLITTEVLDSLRTPVEIQEPFASLLYERTPTRVIVERMLTFEYKRRPRIYTHIRPEQQAKNKLALFFSAKGGVGKTTIAINVATQLAVKKQNVLLVDFATFGNIGILANVPRHHRGLSEAISYLEQSTWEKDTLRSIIEKSIYTTHIRGVPLHILAAASPMKMASLDLTKTDEIINVIRDLDYDVTIIDTSSDLSEKNISLISAVDDLLYVTTTDIAANATLLAMMELVETLNRPLQNRYLIVNHYNETLNFPIVELEQILSMDVSAVIPDKYEQIQGYANRGIVVSERQALKINRYYRQVAHLIQPIFTDKELGKRKKLLSVGGKRA